MDKDTALSLFAQADAMYREGRYAQSLSTLREIARFFPDNQAVLYATALCLENVGGLDEAIRLCDRLVHEHHYDKAAILKARLITAPGDISLNTASDAVAPEWPEKADAFASCSAPAVPVSRHSPFAWYIGAAIALIAMMALLAFFTIFFAQAETAVPGASPTLFPGRLLTVYCLVMFTAVTALVFCVAGANTARTGTKRANLAKSVCCAGLCLVPVLGWLIALLLMRPIFRFSCLKSAVIILMAAMLHIIALVIIAYALDMTSLHAIYMELKAGYG